MGDPFGGPEPSIDAGLHSPDARTLLWLAPDELLKIKSTPIMIIGCGGTGSLFATFAARVGFRNLIIVDDDALDASNLNRFINAGIQDVGRRKVDIVRSDVENLLPDCIIEAVPDRFPSPRTLQLLKERRPTVIGCVDLVKPRVELDIACRRFGLTYLDIGTGFGRDDNHDVADSGGQVVISQTGEACVMCLGFPHLVDMRDYVTPGVDDVAASVLTLNSAVVTMGLEILLTEARGVRLRFNRLRYNRASFETHTVLINPDPECRICGHGSNDSIAAVLGRM